MSYSDLDAAAFYQAAFTDDNDNNDTIESPRLPLLKKSPRTRTGSEDVPTTVDDPSQAAGSETEGSEWEWVSEDLDEAQ
jgi:hypothetical protein